MIAQLLAHIAGYAWVTAAISCAIMRKQLICLDPVVEVS